VRLFDRLIETVGCLLLVALLIDVLLGVATRAADAPLIWTDEGARFLMVWLACFGWMIAGRRRAHVRIRYFQGLLPGGLHRAAERTIHAAMAVLGLALAWFAVGLVRRNLELEATSLPISMAWLYVPIIPAGLAMAAQSAAQTIERAAVGVVAEPAE
jgi:TRAP-type C4-dicarboxylate transport system permease small subunit